MVALSVNLNKIALLRNSRDTANPSVPGHAAMALAAGAAGITVHPRPDQRHIRAEDCPELARVVANWKVADGEAVEFNIEGNPFSGPRPSDRAGVGDYPGFMALVREIKPHQCTLVPDGDGQLTSDHGFDLRRDGDRVAPLVGELKALGIRSSLFLDPDPEQVQLAAQTGADRIELYTETYAAACKAGANVDGTLARFRHAAEVAAAAGLGVNAGHDLDLDNLPRFAAEVPGLLEVSIGHALTVDAIRLGFAPAIAAYRRALNGQAE